MQETQGDMDGVLSRDDICDDEKVKRYFQLHSRYRLSKSNQIQEHRRQTDTIQSRITVFARKLTRFLRKKGQRHPYNATTACIGVSLR